jgi:hypothetical protein
MLIRPMLALYLLASQAGASERTFSSIAIERMVVARTGQEYKDFRALSTQDMIRFRASRCPKTAADEQISFSNWVAMNDAMGKPFPFVFMPRNKIETERWVVAYWTMLNEQAARPAEDAFIALAPIAKVLLIGVIDKTGCFVDLRAVSQEQFKRFREIAIVEETEL